MGYPIVRTAGTVVVAVLATPFAIVCILVFIMIVIAGAIEQGIRREYP